MLKPTIMWFHIVTGHPGSRKLWLTLEQKYYHPGMSRYIDDYKCAACQHDKLDGRWYGLLLERKLREQPFEEVSVDIVEHLFLCHIIFSRARLSSTFGKCFLLYFWPWWRKYSHFDSHTQRRSLISMRVKCIGHWMPHFLAALFKFSSFRTFFTGRQRSEQ